MLISVIQLQDRFLCEIIFFFFQGCVYKITPTCIDVQLTKQGEGEWWPRLIPEKAKKPHFLKLDFDRWKSESDLEDNNLEYDANDEQLVCFFDYVIFFFLSSLCVNSG